MELHRPSSFKRAHRGPCTKPCLIRLSPQSESITLQQSWKLTAGLRLVFCCESPLPNSVSVGKIILLSRPVWGPCEVRGGNVPLVARYVGPAAEKKSDARGEAIAFRSHREDRSQRLFFSRPGTFSNQPRCRAFGHSPKSLNLRKGSAVANRSDPQLVPIRRRSARNPHSA